MNLHFVLGQYTYPKTGKNYAHMFSAIKYFVSKPVQIGNNEKQLE